MASVSAELGKPSRFVGRADGLMTLLPVRYAPVIREALAQLTRNSLVHGVEPPDERVRLGKPTVATLQLAVRPSPEDSRRLREDFLPSRTDFRPRRGDYIGAAR